MTIRSLAAPLALALTFTAGLAIAADLALTQTGGGTATPGQSRTFVVTTTSLLHGLPHDVVTTVAFTLQGLTQANASGPGWSCGPGGPGIICTRSSALTQGNSYPAITVTAVVGSGSTYSSCAVVSHTTNAAVQPDQIAGNNTACANGTIDPMLRRPGLERREPNR